MQLKSIGYIKSPIKQPRFGGWQDLVTEIVIDDNYSDGLEGIEEYSHLIILYWLDKVDKVKLKMRPQGKKDVPEVGIFACRCPWRPNPIGMTTVKVIERNGNILRVKGLDVLDGTPLIDIKPYTPPYDAVEGMRCPDWVNKLEYLPHYTKIVLDADDCRLRREHSVERLSVQRQNYLRASVKICVLF